MNDMKVENREDMLLTLLAKPLTRMILSILVGIDPGNISKETLEDIIENS